MGNCIRSFTEHTIKKGHHYATPLELVNKFCGIRSAYGRSMTAYVSFSHNCKYDIGADQSDINKLFGYSIGCRHHSNSVRVGWRYVQSCDKIELVTYIYKDKVRLPEKHLQWCDFGEHYMVRIVSGEKQVSFYCNDVVVRQEIESSGISYPLSLYFGGNMTAPHDMNINLDVDYR